MSLPTYIYKGPKLEGAGGALAPTDFVILKSQTYYKFLASRSQSLKKSCQHPHFLSPIGALVHIIEKSLDYIPNLLRGCVRDMNSE